MDIHDQQQESSQHSERALQSSHQVRLVERNTLRHLPFQTLSSSDARNSADGAMEFGTTTFATSFVDASLTAEPEKSSERDEAILSAMPSSERRKLELSIRSFITTASSSQSRVCANVAMERCQGERVGCRQITPLQCLRRGKPPGVKPVSASHEHREPWRVVGCDLAVWNHTVCETRKVHLWFCFDDAAKFSVGHVWDEGQQVGKNGLGRMHTLRTDPEGVWRKEVHERFERHANCS